jgi:Plasmid pRiA4b ORF-3-like protein
MKRRPKSLGSEEKSSVPAADARAVLQVKVWLTGISPMVWRRVLVPANFTLRETHGVIQVTMGWEGIHLSEFHLRAARYGSWELAASSPDITLAALRLRKGARFIYEYDLNIPWRHEVRIEDRLEPDARKTYPVCTAGDGACPPEDCGGPKSFMDHRDDRFSFDALEDLVTMVEVFQRVALKDESETMALDQETRWRLEDALERAKVREEAQGRPFSRRQVNASLRAGEHRDLMHQQW